MGIYKEKDILCLARRYRNEKRCYLLVNPLQGKHIPVSPKKSLDMMNTLGKTLYDAMPSAKCIIGFAETATAIGVMAALNFPDDVFYLHTTRESIPAENALFFSEEHSHASEQKINTVRLSEIKTGPLILIDDEISTGRTMKNILTVLREKKPDILSDGCLIGSLINRVPKSRIEEFFRNKYLFSYLIRLERDDFQEKSLSFSVSAPGKADMLKAQPFLVINTKNTLIDLRIGSMVGMIRENIIEFAKEICNMLEEKLKNCKKILFLGTEECMFPALYAASLFEERKSNISVYCHATTRSPIGICSDPEYPIQNGVQLESFYESGRKTFLYNLQQYDAAVIITDSCNETQINRAMKSLTAAFLNLCSNFYCIKANLNN